MRARGLLVGALTACLGLGAAVGALSVTPGCCPEPKKNSPGAYLLDIGAGGKLDTYGVEWGRATVQPADVVVEYRLEDGRAYVATFERIPND